MLRTRISDLDAERLLCGKSPKNEALTPLAPILSAFHNVSWPAPSDETVAQFAAKASEIAQSGKPQTEDLPVPSGNGPRWLRPTFQRGLATGLATVLLVSGLSAIAVASDDAAPGDMLYGLDRALEALGVGDGGASERITEARDLFDRGQVAEAIEHAAEAVVVTGDQDDGKNEFSPEAINAAEALRTAADNVQAGNDEAESQDVRNAVAAMLSEMAAMIEDPGLEGKDFGEKVSEMARMIGGENAQPGNSGNPPGPPDDPGPSDGPPGNSGSAPGQSDGAPGQSGGAPANPPGRP